MSKDPIYKFPNDLSDVLDRIFGEVAVNVDTVSDLTDEEISEVEAKLANFFETAWPILLKLAEENGIELKSVAYDYSIELKNDSGQQEATSEVPTTP